MNKEHYLLTVSIIILSAVLTLTGCLVTVPGKVTGGGWIPSISGLEKERAFFAFNADSCEGLNYARGHFNYRDKHASDFPRGVKMNGDILEAYECEERESGTEGCYCDDLFEVPWHEIRVHYRSTDPKYPGEGEAIICMRDNGEGKKAVLADTIHIEVTSGPYAGYINTGAVQGNIQAHECEEVGDLR